MIYLIITSIYLGIAWIIAFMVNDIEPTLAKKKTQTPLQTCLFIITSPYWLIKVLSQ